MCEDDFKSKMSVKCKCTKCKCANRCVKAYVYKWKERKKCMYASESEQFRVVKWMGV